MINKQKIIVCYNDKVSPFGNHRIKACLAAPRRLSQLATPFIACPCQGILRMLLVACPQRSSLELPLEYTRLILFPGDSLFYCQRSNHFLYSWRNGKFYGADRDRTDDLRLAKPALSQLSYSPGWSTKSSWPFTMVGLGRLELPTSSLSGMRSNHLSYRPCSSKTLSELGGGGRSRNYLERR